MATWVPKVDFVDTIVAADINDLQTLKRDIDVHVTNPVAGTPVTITAAMCYGDWITNANATADAEYDLPAAVVGMHIGFYVVAAYKMKIDPNLTDRIMVLTSDAGDFLESDAVVGSFISLICLAAGQWQKVGHAGVWTEE